MNRPILVVMAAGMGSRYGGGGLKQIDPVGPGGEFIIDYSIYDAARAGFDRVVFIIKPEMERVFRETIGARAEKHIKVDYAFQTLGDMPGCEGIPPGRVKPWGTGHAVMTARNIVDQPFAVIGADDFFGAGTFRVLADFLRTVDPDSMHFALAGFSVEDTISAKGRVSRGICEIENGMLKSVRERTWIERKADGHAHYSLDEGKTFTDIPAGTTVSMNTWGFTTGMMDALVRGFPAAIEAMEDKIKGEYYLPAAVDSLLSSGQADAVVLPTGERCFGVTWREDRDEVVAAIKDMIERGIYPENLWK